MYMCTNHLSLQGRQYPLRGIKLVHTIVINLVYIGKDI